MTEPGIAINMDIDYTGIMQEKIGGQLSTLGRILDAIDQGNFHDPDRVNFRTSFTFQVETPPNPEELRQGEIDKTFLAMVRSLVDLVDTLLAYKELMKDGIQVTRELKSHEELQAYVEEYVRQEVEIRTQKIAADGRRSAHQKVDELGTLPELSKKILTGLFLIRRAIEHHKRIAKSDIEFVVLHIAAFVEGEQVMQLPFPVNAGQMLEMRVIERSRILPKGDPILLTEDDIQEVGMTILQELVPALQSTFTATLS